MSTIEIKNLTKRYGEAEVLSNINMKLESGKIYGLVGRNGSGKTMLMKHILGFVKPTQGTIFINGKAVGENDDMQENIGAIIENPGFLPEYSGRKPGFSMIAPIFSCMSSFSPTAFPFIKIVPCVGFTNPRICFISIVFPEPFLPTSP